ncbi:hypothetical protein Ciccas_008745 [Cichlidogyrus casuarinus]|uniref:Dynein light chain n=1 Tax=Cichlidogyrus casuarinus TaxID=1844966 RepID=A0ABD2PZ00_9PLAT
MYEDAVCRQQSEVAADGLSEFREPVKKVSGQKNCVAFIKSLAHESMKHSNVDSEVAILMKTQLDSELGRAWHVICGQGPYGSNVASLPDCLAHFHMNGWAFLVWNTPEE